MSEERRIDKLTDYTILNEKPYLMERVTVLEPHGTMELIDWHGSDRRIVDAARLSYQKGTKKVQNDENLIDYLVRHLHMGPLEMCSMTFYFEMPLYVVAQLVRHRTAKMNQESARYSELEDKVHVPKELRGQGTGNNKQQSNGLLSEDLQEIGIQVIEMHNDAAYATYKDLLELGVGREQARGVMPTASITKLMWQSDLRNLFNFLMLRLDEHAQPEIREYANFMNHLAAQIFPFAHKAFEEHILFSTRLSRTEINIVRELLQAVPESFGFVQQLAEHFEMRSSVRDEMMMKLFGRKE